VEKYRGFNKKWELGVDGKPKAGAVNAAPNVENNAAKGVPDRGADELGVDAEPSTVTAAGVELVEEAESVLLSCGTAGKKPPDVTLDAFEPDGGTALTVCSWDEKADGVPNAGGPLEKKPPNEELDVVSIVAAQKGGNCAVAGIELLVEVVDEVPNERFPAEEKRPDASFDSLGVDEEPKGRTVATAGVV
jgi:hypothetical protein